MTVGPDRDAVAGRLARGGALLDGWIEVERERVAALGKGPPPRPPDERVDGLIAPGFVDLQINGAVGREACGGAEALDAIDDAVLTRGVTSYLPTLVSPTTEEAGELLGELERRAADPASPVVGVHVRGRSSHPHMPGCTRPARLRTSVRRAPGTVRRPAATGSSPSPPELEAGATALVAELRRRRGQVALGHSGSYADQALSARSRPAPGWSPTSSTRWPPLDPPRTRGRRRRARRRAAIVLADRGRAHVDPLVLALVAAAAGAGRVDQRLEPRRRGAGRPLRARLAWRSKVDGTAPCGPRTGGSPAAR